MDITPSLIRRRLSEHLPVILFGPTPAVEPRFVEMAAQAGYHGVWIDQEHQNYTDTVIAGMCVACRAGGIDPMVRLRKCFAGSHCRCLEMGATSLMLPHVNGAPEAVEFVRECKFPPEGNRSADGIEPPAKFGWVPFLSYVEQINREIVLSVQIEEPEAVDNVDAIAAVEGVDLLFVGPGDLGLRYGEIGLESQPGIEAAIEATARAAEKHGKWWGMPAGGCADVRKRMDQGALFFVSGSMWQFAYKGFMAFRADFGELLALDGHEGRPGGVEPA